MIHRLTHRLISRIASKLFLVERNHRNASYLHGILERVQFKGVFFCDGKKMDNQNCSSKLKLL